FVVAMLAASSGIALWRLSAVEERVQQVVRGDGRLAGLMAQLVLHEGDMARYERAYLTNLTRSRPAENELQAWKSASAAAGQRLADPEGAPAGRSTARPLRTLPRGYDTEFPALRSRMEGKGITRSNPRAADGARTRTPPDRLERQSSDQLV